MEAPKKVAAHNIHTKNQIGFRIREILKPGLSLAFRPFGAASFRMCGADAKRFSNSNKEAKKP
jgi:hypothetical protein